MQNGLSGRETNRSAGLIDSKGGVWIGTDLGLSHFMPEESRKPVAIPKIRLLYVENDKGERNSLNESCSISYGDNTLSFHFRAISYLSENLITYKYKLEGCDENWQEINQSMLDKVRYSNLKPGEYRFYVMAKNFSGSMERCRQVGTDYDPISILSNVVVLPDYLCCHCKHDLRLHQNIHCQIS